MIRIAIFAAALTVGLNTVAWPANPATTPPAHAAPALATPVVDVYVGGYYGGYPYRRYYRPYPGRPWYYYGGPPVIYEAPPPVVIVSQPPPQPIWTGTGVMWLFSSGAPQ
jgi:hypothetical protein